MNKSSVYVELALKLLNCNQKELAEKLGVSSAQVTKWKQDEKMSPRLKRALVALVDLDPSYLTNSALTKTTLLTGSHETTRTWVEFIDYIAVLAFSGDPRTLLTRNLTDESYHVSWQVISIMSALGHDVTQFPTEFNIDWISKPDEYKPHDQLADIIFDTPVMATMYELLVAYYVIKHWVDECIAPTLRRLPDEVRLGSKAVTDFYDALMAMALHRTDAYRNEEIPRITADPESPLARYACSHIIKRLKLFVAGEGLPFTAEYNDILTGDLDEMSDYTDHDMLDALSDEGHPDIYLNKQVELLEKTRDNNVMLKLLCKKLGVSDEDIKNGFIMT